MYFTIGFNLLLNVDGNPSLCGGGLKLSSGTLWALSLSSQWTRPNLKTC